MRHTKKQAMGPIHTETVFERTHMLDLAHKDFKAAVINMSKELKETMLVSVDSKFLNKILTNRI